MYSDPLLEEAESEYVTPHYRRAIFETNFRKRALQAGLSANTMENSRGSAKYTIVHTNEFVITASYANERFSRLRYSQFRTNYSALNKVLSQRQFDFNESSANLDGGTPIYCVLLHGPSAADKSAPGFADFVFPNASGDDWVASYTLAELLVGAQARHAPVQKDGAIPIFKPKGKEVDGTET